MTTTTTTPQKPAPAMGGITYDRSSGSNCTIRYDHMGKGVVPQAMRRIRKLWPLAYTKLLSLQWLASSSTAYGATDGRRLLLNPKGLDNLMRTSDPVGYTAFLLVHESLHALLNHGTRLKKFTDHRTANIAADYVINRLIKLANTEAMHKFNLNRVPFPFIEGILYDESLDGDTSVEQLYQKLKHDADADDTPDNQPDQPQDCTPSEDGGDDDLSDAGDSQTEVDDSSEPQQGDSGDDTTEGGDGGDDESSDGHTYGGSDAEGDADILGDSWVGTAGGEDTIEPEVDAMNGETIEDVEQEIDRENERTFLQDEINETTGLGGSCGRRDLNTHKRPPHKQRWQDIIRNWMTNRTSGGWRKPCNVPLYQSTGMISAGRENNSIGTWIMVVDTSGSMSTDTLNDVLGNIQDAIDSIKPQRTIILPVDHAVREAHEVTHGGRVPISLDGGGGTRFQVAFDHIADYYPEAEGIVFLTDGWAADFHSMTEPNIPLLWLTYGKDEDVYPFGDAVKVDLYR